MIWIAIHIKPRCEEKASHYYTKIGIENYYPFVKKTKKKAGKISHCISPAIRGYLFIKMNPINYDLINENPYTLSLVRNLGKIAEIPEEEMAVMKQFLGHGAGTLEQNTLLEGKDIEITSGVLQGKRGTIVEKRNNHILLFVHSLKITIKINLKGQTQIAA